MKAHWTELLPKLSISFADQGLVSSLSSFCDAGMREDIKEFFAANPRPAAARALTQTIEGINTCVALRTKQGPALTDWFAQETTR